MYEVIEVQFDEWESLYSQVHNSPLVQAWQYGEAKQNISKWKAERFKVVNRTGDPIALAQFLVFDFTVFGGIARLNRGPLLIGELSQNEEITPLVIFSLLRYAKKRRWWMAQFAPGIKQSEQSDDMLSSLSLKKCNHRPVGSALVCLQTNEEDLFKGLKKKWRYSLRKAEQQNFSITRADCMGNEFSSLKVRYKALKDMKRFSGLSESLLDSLAHQSGKHWNMELFYANENSSIRAENSLGMLLTVRHGDTATYLVGVTEEEGRRRQVNYILLWDAILAAKSSGCQWFDLGGLDDTTPEGIAHFKRGINANPYMLVGEWRYYITPWKRWVG